MNLDKVRCVMILGDLQSGKTNLMKYLLVSYKGHRERYLYGYPERVSGFKAINTLSDLATLTDAVVGIDEIDLAIKFYHKDTNDGFIELLGQLAHNNVTIIMTTNMSRALTSALEDRIDAFCYTRLRDVERLKQRSKAKRNIERFSHPKFSRYGLALSPGEYFEVVDTAEIGENGLKSFPFMGMGKDWNSKKVRSKVAEEVAEKVSEGVAETAIQRN